MAFVLKAAACSDRGCRRNNNEDNFCLNGLYMQREAMDIGGLFSTEVGVPALFAVCDGMGGEEAGEEASLLSAMLCAEWIQSGEAIAEKTALRKFLHQGCVTVLRQAEDSENNSGSTVAIVYAHKDGILPMNMGDSRIYRFSCEGFTQISQDHTEMQRLLRSGEIMPEQVKMHPRRHMILQYWGMPLTIAPFMPHVGATIPYREGDRYLLCSDGLTDMLTDEEIAQILDGDMPADRTAKMLVDEAKSYGGRDNVTVIVVDVCSDGTEIAENGQFLLLDNDDTADPSSVGHSKKKKNEKEHNDALFKQRTEPAELQSLKNARNGFAGLLGILGLLDIYLIFEWIEKLIY